MDGGDQGGGGGGQHRKRGRGRGDGVRDGSSVLLWLPTPSTPIPVPAQCHDAPLGHDAFGHGAPVIFALAPATPEAAHTSSLVPATHQPAQGLISACLPPPVPAFAKEVKKPSTSSTAAMAATQVCSTAAAKDAWEVDLAPALKEEPTHHGSGTIGAKDMMCAENFLLDAANNHVFRYDVTINPELKSRQAKREVLDEIFMLYGHRCFGRKLLIYDGAKSIYTPGPLPLKSEEFVVRYADPRKEKERAVRKYTITIQHAGRTDMYHLMHVLLARQRDTPRGIIQLLDVVLRELVMLNYASLSTDLSIAFYNKRYINAEGFECWRDKCTRPFFKPVSLIKFVEILLDIRDTTRPLSYTDIIKKTLEGIHIETSHQQDRIRRYKITGITPIPVSQTILPYDNQGSLKTVVQYFWEKYDCRLKYAYWPCIEACSDSCAVYLPMEMVLSNGLTNLDQASILSVSEVPTTNLGVDVKSYLQDETAESSIVTVFVCVFDQQIPVTVNLRKATVLDVVEAALFKRKIKVRDAYLYLEGRSLSGNEVLNSLPLGRDSHIRLGPRSRGGVAFVVNQPLYYDSLDHVLLDNFYDLFETIALPPDLMITGDQHPASRPICFWSRFTCYLVHRLFVLVFWDGHLHGKCYAGGLTAANIGVNVDGQLKINCKSWDYTPDGGRLDCLAIVDLIDQLLRIPISHEYPVHVVFLVNLLSNHSGQFPMLWTDPDFLTFLMNFPCLLSHADKHKWYNLINLKILQLNEHQLANLRQIFMDPMYRGWETYVAHVPALMDKFMYNARFDLNTQSYVSVYTSHLDQAFRLGRNFLNHPPAQITEVVAEAAVSSLLDQLLTVFVFALVFIFAGPPNWKRELMSIISNSNSDKSSFN